ncbi:TPA: hypothetical protein ACP32N_003275 [Pseudomonas aeruginosa]
MSIVMVVLTGCGQTTEQICNETNQLFLDHGQPGFTETGYLGCLKASPEEANRSLRGLQEQFKEGEALIQPRAQVESILKGKDVFALIKKYGQPAELSYTNGPAMQKGGAGGDGSDKFILDNYVGNSKNQELRDQQIKLKVLNEFIQKKDGLYVFKWYRVSSNIFGAADDYSSLVISVEHGVVVETVVLFPEYFWQRWFS